MTKRSPARVFRGTIRNIAFLARKLRAGEIVAVPSETVYGLAGNALDPSACAKIFEAKGRPADDPLIIHIHSLKELDVVAATNAAAGKLAARFWPGPLTLVLPKKPMVPDIVTAGRDSVAVRMPSHPLLRRLLQATGLPLAAPSANPFGYISPTTVEHVRHGLGDRIRYILDGGPAQIGVESTIVDLRNPERPRILRPGFITAAQISLALSRPVPLVKRASSKRGQIAPGMLERHYSPRTPLVLHDRISFESTHPSAEAWILLRRPIKRSGKRASNIYWLDPQGNLRGVARHLFAMLRKLDRMKYDAIHIELAPGEGLADAINDRLRRAAAR